MESEAGLARDAEGVEVVVFLQERETERFCLSVIDDDRSFSGNKDSRLRGGKRKRVHGRASLYMRRGACVKEM